MCHWQRACQEIFVVMHPPDGPINAAFSKRSNYKKAHHFKKMNLNKIESTCLYKIRRP